MREPTAAAARVEQTSNRGPCKLARRAPRMWVEFSSDMNLDDFELTAAASEAVVVSIDRALCALSERRSAAEAQYDAPLELRRCAAARQAFTVTYVRWHDAAHESASAGLQPSDAAGMSQARRWLVTVTRDEHGYRVVSFGSESAPPR